MINKLFIRNYRSIKKIEINNISNSLGFIGENSSGKSAILSAVLTFLGEKDIKESDFRFDKNGNREDEIIIGIGLDLDDFLIKKILYDVELNESKPLWYLNALHNSKGKRTRNKESKSYIKDFKQNLKKEWGISKNSTSIYFKIEYKKSKSIEKSIFITMSNFKDKYQINLNQEEVLQIKKIIQPRYAYLHDERNFNEEGLGKADSTTNKLFNLLLPSLNVNRELENKTLEETPISELSIPQINQYLLKKIHAEAKEVTAALNRNFKESYNDNVEIEWQFSNQLFENINIKTNFRFSNINSNIDFQSVGSGTRSMYKIVLLQTLLEMQKTATEPVLFLLEEPELYLYPKLEKQMSKFIYDIAKLNQVFVTTHSHMSIVSFREGSLFKTYRENETKYSLPVTKIQSIDSSLEAMKLLGYDISYLLGKEYLIFVEGKEDKKAYEHLIKTVFGDQLSLKFLIMTSVTKFHMAINCSVLKLINTNSRSVYIIDSDGGESQKLKEKTVSEMIEHDKELKKEDLNNIIIITKYCMIECYTLEKELLINNKMTDADFYNKKIEFINKYENQINKCLEDRGLKKLDELNTVEEKFEYVRKYGFTKQLIKDFRGVIQGAGFKKLNQLNKGELELYCPSLIQELKTILHL